MTMRLFVNYCVICSMYFFCILAIGACSDGEILANDTNVSTSIESAALPNLSIRPVKQLIVTWTDVANATHYRLLENIDGSSGFIQLGRDIPQGTEVANYEIALLHSSDNTQYILQTCSATNCINSNSVSIIHNNYSNGVGYVKASNARQDNYFGRQVKVSSNGQTLAVAAPYENRGASGIDGDQFGTEKPASGAVYIYGKSGGFWRPQQAYIKASNSDEGDSFGFAISLSARGNTLAVGAPSESSGATGINGNQIDNSAQSSGAVYVFSRQNNIWSQEAYIKASNTEEGDLFGASISLSEDGDTLAVAAVGESSGTIGINGDEIDNSAPHSGAVYVFSRQNNIWSQQAYLKASNTGKHDDFGRSVSLSEHGDRLAIGASREDSMADDSGAAYVFARFGTTWNQQASLKALSVDENALFGSSVSLNAAGDFLVVGAPYGFSNTPALADNSLERSGSVFLFFYQSGVWLQLPFFKATDPSENDRFGISVSLSASGDWLAVGATGDNSHTIGINGDRRDDSADGSGAAYLFPISGATAVAFIKASNTDSEDSFGSSVSLSSDGKVLAVGAPFEDGNAQPISGAADNSNSRRNAGAVYLY